MTSTLVNNSAPIDEKTILATLEKDGLTSRDYFFVGDHGDRDLICFWEPTHGRLMALIIENNELAYACKRYLLKHGARRFSNESEVEAVYRKNDSNVT